MNQNLKKLLRLETGSILLILFGGILLFNPDFGSAALSAIIGWVLVGCGAGGIAMGLLSWPLLGVVALLGSVAVLLFGIYLLRNPLMLASLVGVILGTVLLFQGVGALWDAVRVRRCGGKGRMSLILGIAMTALGIYLTVSPMTTSRFVMTVAGLVMVACGITNLISHYRADQYITGTRKKIIGDSNIIDADE